MTPRVLKPRPQAPGPAPKFEGCGWFVTPSPDSTPHRLGEVDLCTAAGTRQRFGSGGPTDPFSSAARIGPPQSGAFASEKAGDTPSLRGLGRSRAEERAKASEAGSGPAPGPRKFPVSVPLLFSYVRRSFLFCKSGLITLTSLSSGVSCGSDK